MTARLSDPDDVQIGGDHYTAMSIQPWAAFEAWLTPEQFRGYLLATGIAYLARYNAQAPGKGGRQDIDKARHCLDKLSALIARDDAR